MLPSIQQKPLWKNLDLHPESRVRGNCCIKQVNDSVEITRCSRAATPNWQLRASINSFDDIQLIATEVVRADYVLAESFGGLCGSGHSSGEPALIDKMISLNSFHGSSKRAKNSFRESHSSRFCRIL